ncbi:MAG: hypothetical protein DMF56_27015 [Acidobacteria bacterium]|nr:MAG: hypothetical protein DMF56_27015 [Acidobacteriota bacterium]
MKISELLTDASKWTQRTYARDEFGDDVAATDPKAVSWCLVGALVKCYAAGPDSVPAEQALRAAWARWSTEHEKNPTASTLTGWNDAFGRTFEEVKQLVEEAGV